ncbi:universal stress protein [Sphingobium sp. CCH11-B1]|jgi:nucleotide-binding universal stress UspA family protein|uniref:universal stress protein n=1 Tax=Sphingobium sp. CCH11-B1 TaxID=1768781 RepID=UPI000835F061|nr:universal stress protein [Sphingobium sp. CCH11-B1]MEA3390942.1 universal stress protein [Pseudomonadota bacterium]
MKSVLLHIHDDLGQEGRLQAAFDIARATGAHIRCVQVTMLPDLVAADLYGGAGFAPTIMAELRDIDRKAQAEVETRMAREGVQWDWLQCEGEAVSGILSAARLSDLIVATLPQGARRSLRDPLAIVPDLALGGRLPVLGVPQAAARFPVTGRAMVAWDGSQEAAAALRAAMPLLKLADAVLVVTVEETEKQVFPAIDAPEYLSRHGIEAELRSCPRREESVDDVLMHAIETLAIDWAVMGAYGHGRLRETVFGGVTHRLLRDTPIPLLLAH